jgi:hypothetical protein
MKTYVGYVLLVISVCAITLPASAQRCGDDPTGSDHMPYCTISGNPGPCHVTPSDPGEENGSIVSYTVHGEARGVHPYTTNHNKISALSLFTYKGANPPSPTTTHDDVVVGGVTKPIYSQPDGYSTWNLPGWTFKWQHSYVDLTLNQNEGGQLWQSLPLVADFTWNCMYYAAGEFSWLGGANDDYGFSSALWGPQTVTTSPGVQQNIWISGSAWTAFSDILGKYHTN